MALRLRVSAQPSSPLGKFGDVFERVTTENPGEFQLPLFIPDAECEHFVNYVRQPAADSFRRALLVNRAETDGAKANRGLILSHTRVQTQAHVHTLGTKVTEDLTTRDHPLARQDTQPSAEREGLK